MEKEYEQTKRKVTDHFHRRPRSRCGDLGTMPIAEFIAKVREEIDTKAMD
ncbi:MAG: hypothetical protein J5544_02985 [Clostridia bacterium]|nr:hypothetical protein [Clostridia bacterium]